MQLTSGIFETLREQLDQQYNRDMWLPFDGLSDEELDKSIRSVYVSLKEQQVPFQIIRAKMIACALENCRIQVANFDPFANICHHPQEILKIRNERYLAMPKEYMNPEHYTDDRSLCEGLYFAHLDLSHTDRKEHV